MPRLTRIAAQTKSTSIAMTVAAVLLAGGCTIQDVFRTTLGGVNSDQATLNKVNPSNEHSYPQEDNRTEWRLPGVE